MTETAPLKALTTPVLVPGLAHRAALSTARVSSGLDGTTPVTPNPTVPAFTCPVVPLLAQKVVGHTGGRA